MVKGVVGDLESFFRPSVASVFTFCTENSRATVGKSWKTDAWKSPNYKSFETCSNERQFIIHFS